MQPQQPNLVSLAGTDAARLHRSAALPTVADDVRVAGAPADNNAAAPAATTRTVVGSLKRAWCGLQRWRRRRRLWVGLHELNERQLSDIGVARADIEYIVARRRLENLKSRATGVWMH